MAQGPSPRTALRRLDGLIATVGGVGLLPGAPGTWGSLAALPLGWAIIELSGYRGLFIALLVVSFVGVWAADRFAKSLGRNDPGCIVIDEVAGQFVALLVVPKTLVGFAAAFLLFRLFDIVKPWPIREVERRLGGGFGIVADDIVAGAVAALLAGPALALIRMLQ